MGFVLDSMDMAMSVCCLLVVLVKIALELRLKERLAKMTLLEIIIALICLSGIIYEARIATSFRSFLMAETSTASILRSFKCFKLVLLLCERKFYWKKLYDLIVVYKDTLSRVLAIFCLWLILILGFAIIGHHIEGGRILVDDHGRIDLDGGRPNRFNFSTIYHSLIFVLLDSFDEEWDTLMFREYLGINPTIVIFQMIVMFICYLFFFKYLTGSFTDALDEVLEEAEEKGAEGETASNDELKE